MNTQKTKSHLAVVSLLLLFASMSLQAAEQQLKPQINRAVEAKPLNTNIKLAVKPQRPLAFNNLKTSGLSATQRIALEPRYAVTKPDKTLHREGLDRSVVIVKFADGVRIREKNTSSQRKNQTNSNIVDARLDDLAFQQSSLDDYDKELLKRRKLSDKKITRQLQKFRRAIRSHRVRHWKNLFDLDENLLANLRLNAEITRKRQAADLSNYYFFKLESEQKGEELADKLNQLDIVEIAYLAPIPKPADIPPTTSSFQGQQTYLNKAPGGIDAKYAWSKPGGKGDLVKIIDIEGGWNLNHEDLPSMFITDGRISDEESSREHGTAVMGIMLGLDDGIGITGIVPKASGGVVSVKRGLGLAYFDNVAEAILIAAMKLSPGDIILIEQHARGPGKDGDCTACITSDGKARDQCGYIAMEYWNDIFDAIYAASASGLIVVEAAGNGEMKLDHARYKDRFDRNYRDSGALLVGAGEWDTRKPKCWTNHGTRVDVQGWGENVTTAGYGDLAKVKGSDINQWYTNSFSGTSSATPIVAGAVAAIQGIQIENNNPVLDWYEISQLLKATGTAQTGSKQIGPLPDLRTAIDSLAPPVKETAVFDYEIMLTGDLLDADRNVSGFVGDRTRTLGEAADLGAIERLNFGERSDRPCYVRVEKADIVDNKILKPHDELDICGNKGPTDKSKNSGYVPLLTTSHDTFVHGVSVCNSKTNNSTRLKGAKVYRTKIEDDGSFSRLPGPSEPMERPNCDGNWRTPAFCPAGSVATKLVVHIRPDGNNEIFTGLSLKCKKVEVIKTCTSGC